MDKASLIYYKIKERLDNCSMDKNWYIEILRRVEYISANNNIELKNCKNLIMHATPILKRRILGFKTSSTVEVGLLWLKNI